MRSRTRALPTAVVAAAAIALALPASGQAASPGTFAGTLGSKLPKGAKAEVRAVDRASGSVVKARGISRSGAFSLSLPAGQYLVIGSVIGKPGKGAKVTTTQVAVSLKAGQKRTKAKLNARKGKKAKKKTKKRRAAKHKRGRAAYAQELGQVTPGNIAIELPAFTGATGELAVLNRGIAAMLITDVVGASGECDVTVVEVEHRDDIIRELEFQQSPYVDPATRVKRNFVIGDVEVKGTLKNGPGNKTLDYDVRLIDKRSGKEVGKLSGTMETADFFDAAERLAKHLSEELCKLSDTYEVTLHVDGTGNFATHTATGTVDSKLTVKRSGRKSRVWKGSGSLAWANPVLSPKVPCQYTAPVMPVVAWNVTMTAQSDTQFQVDWGVPENDMMTVTVVACGDPPSPPVPGQPGTALLQIGPLSFPLPTTGGVQQISGGFQSGGDGWTNNGTMTIKPAGIERMD